MKRGPRTEEVEKGRAYREFLKLRRSMVKRGGAADGASSLREERGMLGIPRVGLLCRRSLMP
jgi:hypothetical protein